MRKLYRLLVVAIAALAMTVGGLVFASSASATQTVVVKAKIVTSAVASAKATSASNGDSAAYSYAAAQILSKRATTRRCFWTTGTNSYFSGGKLIAYYDPVKSKVCKLKRSVWIGGRKWTHKKVGGGTSGRNCGNLFIPGYKRVSYKRVPILDVKSGAVASVAVTSTAKVGVAVKIDATLQYTYEGKTHTIHRSASDSGSDQETRSGTAQMRVYKSTSLKATKSVIDKKKVSVRSSAHAAAQKNATANAHKSALLKVDLTVVIKVHERGVVIEAQAKSCVKKGEANGVVTVTGENPNDVATVGTFTLSGREPKTANLTASGRATVTFDGFAPGSYSGTFSLGEPINKSVTFSVTVLECPDNPPPPYECPPNTKWTDIDKDGKKEEGECFEAPVFVEFREFNDLYRSLPGTPTTMNHFVTVDTPAGHSFSVTWSTVWGSFATPTKTGQDGVEVGNTYTAPSEVPPAHTDAGLAAGYDKITVTVTDNVTGQKITRSSAPFRIKEWPTTP